ncbi:hypothetical protein EII29_10635 [Leptotrichia sp. OH3620_COT-345]|uniref:hypothetical protein n=1 Tax=Leptotrichia sp. OH3620_COT-345 TaxID=2491048 RepID=UPI000F64BFE9|nr:hypothetical protein [Leptotrichia sp. OH3620_COT-345]RRD38095.1 hypothetical protein EII29_10635 [Leptotrichia sp. OH3620_COT-345]
MNIIKKYKNYIWTGIFTIVTALVFSTADLMTDEIKLLETLSLLGSDRISHFVILQDTDIFSFLLWKK